MIVRPDVVTTLVSESATPVEIVPPLPPAAPAPPAPPVLEAVSSHTDAEDVSPPAPPRAPRAPCEWLSPVAAVTDTPLTTGERFVFATVVASSLATYVRVYVSSKSSCSSSSDALLLEEVSEIAFWCDSAASSASFAELEADDEDDSFQAELEEDSSDEALFELQLSLVVPTDELPSEELEAALDDASSDDAALCADSSFADEELDEEDERWLRELSV